MTPGSRAAAPSPFVVITAVLLLLGFALQVFLWSRQWIYGDQYALLTPAVQYLESGEFQPFSKGMSGGGRIPGTLLQRLIAGPLQVWLDFRSPTLAMGFSQVAAVVILLLTLTAALGRRVALFFVALYWLSPWRLYHSGFLWEPGFLFLPAALHLSCCWILRTSPRLGADDQVVANFGTPPQAVARVGASVGLGAVLVASPQIHASFVVLVLATAGLLLMRRIRPQVPGVVAGAILAGITLMPTISALWNDELDSMVPQVDQRLSLPLLVLSNVGKAAGYWLRMGSADIGRRLRQTAWLGETPAGTEAAIDLPAFLVAIVSTLTVASLLIAVIANVSYWRQRRLPAHSGATPISDEKAAWVGDYVGAMLLALLAAAALSPVPVQGWHMVIALHAACIPVALWLADAFDHSLARRSVVIGLIAVMIVTAVLLGLGHEMYLRPDAAHVLQQDIPDYLRPLIPPDGN